MFRPMRRHRQRSLSGTAPPSCPGDLRRPGRGRRRRLPLCGPPQLCVSGGNAVLPLCQGRAQAGRPASVQQGVLLRYRSGSGGPPGVHHLLSQRHRLRPDPYFGGRGRRNKLPFWLLAEKYCPGDSPEHRQEAIRREAGGLCLVSLSIEHMTGKQAIELVQEDRRQADLPL